MLCVGTKLVLGFYAWTEWLLCDSVMQEVEGHLWVQGARLCAVRQDGLVVRTWPSEGEGLSLSAIYPSPTAGE